MPTRWEGSFWLRPPRLRRRPPCRKPPMRRIPPTADHHHRHSTTGPILVLVTLTLRGGPKKNTSGAAFVMTANVNWDALTTVTPRLGYASQQLASPSYRTAMRRHLRTNSPFFGTLPAGGGTGSGRVVAPEPEHPSAH